MAWPNGDDHDGNDGAGGVDPDGQLTLAADDDALPWLATDDDEDEPREGSDYRIIVFALVALVALAGILLGTNYLFGQGAGQAPEADGSTIAAPEGPYKTRPDNPGGTEVAGTGDLSYEVGEGQSREGQIATQDEPPAPSIDVEQRSSAGAPAPAAAGVGVQVGAYQTRESAEAGWTQLAGRFEALQGVSHRVIEGRADSGTIFRLQAVAADVAGAEALCRSIKAAGGDCQVKR